MPPSAGSRLCRRSGTSTVGPAPLTVGPHVPCPLPRPRAAVLAGPGRGRCLCARPLPRRGPAARSLSSRCPHGDLPSGPRVAVLSAPRERGLSLPSGWLWARSRAGGRVQLTLTRAFGLQARPHPDRALHPHLCARLRDSAGGDAPGHGLQHQEVSGRPGGRGAWPCSGPEGSCPTAPLGPWSGPSGT